MTSATILLVEDQEDVRNLVSGVLTACGYHVLAVANGQDALRLTVQFAGRVDLLVTDAVMPGMSGREVALLLAPAHPKMKALYLPQPFTVDGLAQHVREILESP